MSSEIKNYTEAKSAKGMGVAGCLGGTGCCVWIIAIGFLLCFTGIGMLIGIPLIIAGLLMLILAPLVAFGTLKGKCPWCATEVYSTSPEGFNCSACKKRIVIKDKKFFKIE
ncbi:MAG: hypothetical protein AAB305_05480 [Candidatus Zixiibacteriota bacterium]